MLDFNIEELYLKAKEKERFKGKTNQEKKQD